MNKVFLGILIVFVLILSLISSSVYIIDEKEQAVITQFGKPVKTVTEANLYFKIPFIQKVMRFDKRILEWDGAPNEIPTKDSKFINIDTFARWRISDPLQFFKSAKNETLAQSRLDDIIDGAVRDEIANRYMSEIIRSSNRLDEFMNDESDQSEVLKSGARDEIIEKIFDKLDKQFNVPEDDRYMNLGIEILDFEIKRTSYTGSVENKLFSRMISEQNEKAAKYRGEGRGIKETILGEQNKERKAIISNAERQSREIRGDADAQATRIYADAYNKNPEFYKFYKSLETYKSTLDSTTLFILSTDNKYLHFLEK